MTLEDKMKQDEKSEHAARGGGFFKFKEGENKMRILAEPFAIYKDYKLGICYTDCRFQGSMKYLTYVLDYVTGTIKLMEIPYGIFQTIANWQLKVDYKFEGFPMPYDITIDAKDAGTKEVKYVSTPARSNTVISEPIVAELSKKRSIPEIIEKMKDINKQKHQSDGTWDSLHSDPREGRSANGGERTAIKRPDYPEAEIDPADIPF